MENLRVRDLDANMCKQRVDGQVQHAARRVRSHEEASFWDEHLQGGR